MHSYLHCSALFHHCSSFFIIASSFFTIASPLFNHFSSFFAIFHHFSSPTQPFWMQMGPPFWAHLVSASRNSPSPGTLAATGGHWAAAPQLYPLKMVI
jgi:hypothetical protein